MSARRRVLVHGACGRMGERVRAVLEDHPELELGAAAEAPDHPAQGSEVAPGVRLGSDVREALTRSDVAISFSLPDPTLELLRHCAERGRPAVVGTTGFSAEAEAEIAGLAKRSPLVLAANFSVAVNVLFRLVRDATALLGPDYDAEIVEIHHGRKVDAPSGTALALGRTIADARGVDFDRHAARGRDGITGAREPGSIGVQALRGGDVAGEHTVMFLGTGERLELVHRASTRDHFARGAVRAAAWVLGQPPGLYDMARVLGLD